MYALLGQCVEEYGECCDEGLAFARCHLGDLALVEHHAAEELYVVVDHVPPDVVAARRPAGAVDGFVALDRDELLRRREVAVEVVGRDDHRFALREAARRVLHDGESLRKNLVELLLDLLVDALGRLVDLLRDVLLLLERRCGELQLPLQFDDAGLVRRDEVGDALFQLLAAGAQFVVRERLDRRIDGFDFLQVGFDLLAVLVGLRAEKGLDDAGNYIHKCVYYLLVEAVNPTKIVISRDSCKRSGRIPTFVAILPAAERSRQLRCVVRRGTPRSAVRRNTPWRAAAGPATRRRWRASGRPPRAMRA